LIDILNLIEKVDNELRFIRWLCKVILLNWVLLKIDVIDCPLDGTHFTFVVPYFFKNILYKSIL